MFIWNVFEGTPTFLCIPFAVSFDLSTLTTFHMSSSMSRTAPLLLIFLITVALMSPVHMWLHVLASVNLIDLQSFNSPSSL